MSEALKTTGRGVLFQHPPYSQGVAARARGLAPVLGADVDLLEAAAWVHDIGYAPSLTFMGLHQLDGARYLRDAQHADALLCRLVAHHSCAIVEAAERGLADVLAVRRPRPRVSQAASTDSARTPGAAYGVDLEVVLHLAHPYARMTQAPGSVVGCSPKDQ